MKQKTSFILIRSVCNKFAVCLICNEETPNASLKVHNIKLIRSAGAECFANINRHLSDSVNYITDFPSNVKYRGLFWVFHIR